MKFNQDIYFEKNDIRKIPRNVFNREQYKTDTFNMGYLVPAFGDITIPGDTFTMSVNILLRLITPQIRPVMENLQFGLGFFNIPFRLVEAQINNIVANERKNPDGTVDPVYGMSQIITPEGGWEVDSVADHFGLPTKIAPGSVTDLNSVMIAPFRAYALIRDYGFRDENLENSSLVSIENGIYDGVGNITGDPLTDAQLGGAMFKLNKRHDYFTSALPAPQKGAPVTLSIGDSAPVRGIAPLAVLDNATLNVIDKNTKSIDYPIRNAFASGQSLYDISPVIFGDTGSSLENQFNFMYTKSEDILKHDAGRLVSSPASSAPGSYFDIQTTNLVATADPAHYTDMRNGFRSKNDNAGDYTRGASLYADLSEAAGITVNDLRYAIQIQRIKELSARFGNRINEYYLGHFGVSSGDTTLQIPEYLGAVTFDITSHQVVQTSSSTQDSPQGNLSAFCQTSYSGHAFTKSFTEGGMVIGVMGVRVKHRTYSQSINQLGFGKNQFDFYEPNLANIGEQPIYNREIYGKLGTTDATEVFGYQEAGAPLRYLPNLACGLMRPYLQNNLAVGNYADYYSSQPTLSGTGMNEPKENLERTLPTGSQNIPNFMINILFKNKAVRPLPLHSIPGLMDHRGNLYI